MGGRTAALTWRLVYSCVDATYRSSFEVNASDNSSADGDGNILVRPGIRIPLTPRHTGRLVLDYALNDHWDVGANLVASAGVDLHGNENKANQSGAINAQGARITGSGWASGYTVLNLRSTYRIGSSAEVFVRLSNVFDKRYATAGFMISNAIEADGAFRADPADWTQENAVSPAQPRALWAGLRWRWR